MPDPMKAQGPPGRLGGSRGQRQQGRETILLVEDEDGFQARVPASKLEQWEKAQAEIRAGRPPNIDGRRIEELSSRIYGRQGGPKP